MSVLQQPYRPSALLQLEYMASVVEYLRASAELDLQLRCGVAPAGIAEEVWQGLAAGILGVVATS